MRLLLLLFLLAMLLPPTAPAHAYEASVAFNGCNEPQKAALRNALEVTDRKLTELLGKFTVAGSLDEYIKAWFGNNRTKDIRSHYQHIHDMLYKTRTLILACEERNCNHDLFGYSQSNSISVCPEFFAARMAEGYDSQAGTLIHELSHIAADTDDNAYGTGAVRILAHEHPERAINNADSYQYFFEAVTGANVPFRTAGWTPDNSCQWAYDGECDHPVIGTGSCADHTDAADCRNAAARQPQTAADIVQHGRKPTVGRANPKDTCATALNGSCDASCAEGTDYTDCLTGTGSVKTRR